MDLEDGRTWTEDLVEYFRELGGSAHYSDLYRHIEANPRRRLGKEWRAVVRRTIEEHSSDTSIWSKRRLPDLFESVKGLGAGRWALREQSAAAFSLRAGEAILRKDLHLAYGGSRQGGISPSLVSPNILLFSDPISGEEHGYYDGWNDDGSFHYGGSGQRGDQQMTFSNAQVFNHRSDGRALRLFSGSRRMVTYIGEFELAADDPYLYDVSPETNNGPLRQVIVFRLLPVGTVQTIAPSAPRRAVPIVTMVPIENQFVENFKMAPRTLQSLATRNESKLVGSFSAAARENNAAVIRNRIMACEVSGPFLTDIYMPDINLLIEAKGDSSRSSVRMAIGQLLDYRRFLPNPRCAILLPTKPSDDLMHFASAVGIEVIWRDDNKFAATFELFAAKPAEV